IVDGAVVMMENHVRWLEEGDEPQHSKEWANRAAKEVARPMVFGVAIIIAVYLPILFLQGLEGRMFRPMAVTVCSALFGSLVLALTLIPTLVSFCFGGGISAKAAHGEEQNWLTRLNASYARLLIWAMD